MEVPRAPPGRLPRVFEQALTCFIDRLVGWQHHLPINRMTQQVCFVNSDKGQRNNSEATVKQPQKGIHTTMSASDESNPILPRNEERSFRRLKLCNGMDVMLVHEASTTQSCAAMVVRVGSNADPGMSCQGTSTFCEFTFFSLTGQDLSLKKM